MSKVAIVTGGARGIGSAISETLARDNYNVLINYYKSEKNATELAEKLKRENLSVDIFKADISNRRSVSEMVEYAYKKFGRIDVLVNNGGIAQTKLFTDISYDDWDNMIGTNLNSVFYCTREVLKYMLPRKFGKIINISSIWGLVGASCEVHYSVAKGGVIALTKALAKELGPSNINVNCIAPGVIDTDMMQCYSDAEINEIIDEIPLMRMGSPADIANCVEFLASDKSNFITGQVISPNGGIIV